MQDAVYQFIHALWTNFLLTNGRFDNNKGGGIVNRWALRGGTQRTALKAGQVGT